MQWLTLAAHCLPIIILLPLRFATIFLLPPIPLPIILFRLVLFLLLVLFDDVAGVVVAGVGVVVAVVAVLLH